MSSHIFSTLLRLFAVATALVSLLASSGAVASDTAGAVTLGVESLNPGSKVDISGRWLYKPGYALDKGEHPEDPVAPQTGYVTVPVPQMLSRITCWLDDSEGFKAFENRRLAALGFDTDRAEDGWYRLWVDMGPADLSDRRVRVSFAGVAMKCEVYINGFPLGDHVGMFSRFSFDVTGHIHPGLNLLAVHESMERLDPKVISLGEAVTVNLTVSKVVSLDKGMFGPFGPVADNRAYDLHGIWQPVTLEITGCGRIEDAWFIPGLDTAEVRCEVSAPSAPQDAYLTAVWSDAKTGKLFCEVKETRVYLTAQGQTVVLKAPGLHPKLWSPEKPNLYVMDVTLRDESGRILDEYRHKVGFRTFEVRGNGLYLNGRRYWLRGADQLPYGKNPWAPALARKLIRLTHDGNTLVTRTHCTPWNEAWLDAADEIGLGVSLEGMRPWALVSKVPPPSRAIVDHWKMENEDVIRRCRNHPSVLIWTVGNEMMLKDDQNVEKWKILSELVSQTRAVDPTRPVVCSSTYYRRRDFYEAQLRPNKLDDGDMDDLHSYRGWYTPSSFVGDSSWIRESCKYAGERPIIGQEFATGYPNLDDGLPVTSYSAKLMVPQAWVGNDGQSGGDPSVFLEHQRAVTKRLAEELRYQRQDLTSGFMLFSNECWFQHSYDPSRVTPYPVYEAVKYAFAPVGLALETPNRRFFSSETVKTAVFVTDDKEDVDGPLLIRAEFVLPGGRVVLGGTASMSGIKYYDTVRVPLSISAPSAATRLKCTLRIRLLKRGQEISRTQDPVEVFSREWAQAPLRLLKPKSILAVGVGDNLAELLSKAPNGAVIVSKKSFEPDGSRVAVVSFSGDAGSPAKSVLRNFAEGGGTVIVLGAGVQAQALFPECIARCRELRGEFVDMTGAPAPLTDGLASSDFKWWGRGDGKAYVISAAHNLVPDSGAKSLAKHVVVHGYIDVAKKGDYITSPLVEIALGKGRIIFSEFALEDSVGVDPAARRFAANVMAWATSF